VEGCGGDARETVALGVGLVSAGAAGLVVGRMLGQGYTQYLRESTDARLHRYFVAIREEGSGAPDTYHDMFYEMTQRRALIELAERVDAKMFYLTCGGVVSAVCLFTGYCLISEWKSSRAASAPLGTDGA